MRENILFITAALIILCVLPVKPVAAEVTVEERPRIGLVLSGGGAKGIAHVGVLKVLEEAGIRVDYIAGTSMGSIVGALYAIGYNAGTLERIALKMDWGDILADEVSHRTMSMQEKLADGRYAFSFPIRKGGVSLPTGFIPGQKLMKELCRLTLPAHNVRDFRNLTIPFICIATDMETGKPMVFDRGYLPDVLRASMAIPSIFTPVEIEGRLYVDGGIVQNFPVSDTRAMGADIIIGVDVQTPLYSKEELNSLARIMEQSIYFLGEISNRRERKLCDVLITPDMAGFTSSSFDNPAELIRRGEAAARARLPQLMALAKKTGKDKARARVTPPEPKGTFHITRVRIEGLNKVSHSLVIGALGIKTPGNVTSRDLDRAIDRIYGTLFFERVDYRLQPDLNGEMLIIRVAETTTDFIKVGLHYDSDMKAALLLNATFRNIAGEGSKFSFDLNLSENLGAETSYFIQTGLRPGIGTGVMIWYQQFDVNIYENRELIANMNYRTYGGDIILFTTFSNVFALGFGLQKQYTALEKKLAPPEWESGAMDFLNYYGFLNFDSLDRKVFTRRGVFFYFQAMRITTDFDAEDTLLYKPVNKYSLQYSVFFPLHRRITFQVGGLGGIIDGDPVYPAHLFYLGSIYTNQKEVYPFTGFHFMEISGKNMAVANCSLQVEPWNNFYFTLRGNIGKVGEQPEDLTNGNDLLIGAGLTAGLFSLIGPLEVSLATGNGKDILLLHVNIGYRF